MKLSPEDMFMYAEKNMSITAVMKRQTHRTQEGSV